MKNDNVDNTKSWFFPEANNEKENTNEKPSNLFSLKEYYTRLQWWKITIVVAFVEPILILTMFFIRDSFSPVFSWLLIPLFLIIGLTLFWVGIASSVKRFHDINMSGLWVLLHLVPGIGSFIVFILNGFIVSKSPGNKYVTTKDTTKDTTSSTKDLNNKSFFFP